MDAAGKLYFVDRHEQRIYGWSAAEGLTVERDNPLDPVNLAFDKAGDLLVLSSAGPEGTVYSFRPGSPKDQISVVSPQTAIPRPGARAVLPVNYWNNGEFKTQLDFKTLTYNTLAQMFAEDVSTPKARQYVSPDGSCLPARGARIPAGTGRLSGRLALLRQSRYLRVYDAAPGDRIYVSSESEDVTYSAVVDAEGTLSRLAAVCATRR